MKIRKNRTSKRELSRILAAVLLASLMTMESAAAYGPGENRLDPDELYYTEPSNNPAYDNGWTSGTGPNDTGMNPLGDRSQYESNAYAGGPNSDGAKQLLSENENGYYIHSTYRGGTWEALSDGKWRLKKPDGQPVSSEWAYVDGKTYLVDMNGVMLTGWQRVNEKWYYLSSSGAMQTGWLLKEGKYYFLNADGTMAYGWVNSQGSWYYFDIISGVMQTNTRTPDGRYVNAEGVMV